MGDDTTEGPDPPTASRSRVDDEVTSLELSAECSQEGDAPHTTAADTSDKSTDGVLLSAAESSVVGGDTQSPSVDVPEGESDAEYRSADDNSCAVSERPSETDGAHLASYSSDEPR